MSFLSYLPPMSVFCYPVLVCVACDLLQKSFTTEDLTEEMANLEGLMKDLSAITQHQFEC